MPALPPTAISAARPGPTAASRGSGSTWWTTSGARAPECEARGYKRAKQDMSEAVRRQLHGRSKGHRLRAGQARLVETLLPTLRPDLGRQAPADLASLFGAP